ncbi:hypothetical protein [Streptomyces sp. x-45]|uniref:hypothetical protein n=1 Tax=Streptomyces sp. x-45 TaxID=2789281 RepID=UPI0039813CFB
MLPDQGETPAVLVVGAGVRGTDTGGRRGRAGHVAHVDDELVALHVDAHREPALRSSGRPSYRAGEQLAADHGE